MLDIKDAAISEKDSKPLIERMLFGQKRKQVAEDEMKRLRSAAKIEYINKKFEPTAVSSAATPAAPTPTAKPAESVKREKRQSQPVTIKWKAILKGFVWSLIKIERRGLLTAYPVRLT